MSTTFLQFSEVVPKLTPEEEAWLRRELEWIYVFGEDTYPEDHVPDHLDLADADWHGCRCYMDLESFDPEEGTEGAGFEYAFQDDDGRPDGWGRYLWVYADEGADLNRLAHLVRKFLCTHRPGHWWSLTYCLACTRPQASESSGGGIFITAEDIKWFDAHGLIENERQAFEQRRPVASPEIPSRSNP
jgi:hypothetical protein